jgi:hypothetical protein
MSDRRLHDRETVHDEREQHPDDIGSFDDEGGASPGDSRRWRRDGGPSPFREQLRDRIGAIHRRGGPAAGAPESFGIECQMDTGQLGALQSLIGECNDAPFCGADPGRLTLERRVRSGHDVRGRFAVTVHFAYAGSPTAGLGRAGATPHPAGPDGRRSRVQHGADFAGHLP